jgi:hypothetical protein
MASDLNDYLIDGEKIIWVGQPAQGLLLSGRDWFLIPFSLLWGGFALFWETIVVRMPQSPIFMKLWGIPFILIGLYLIVGRFLTDAWIRRSLQYAITNKRILIYRSGPFGKFTALSLKQLPATDIIERADSTGTIRFGQAASLWSGNARFSSWTPALDPTPQFLGIDSVRDVFAQIQRATQTVP